MATTPTYKEPKIVCVDFDKTICDSSYPELGPLIPGAREALQAFRDMGYRIVISSCRSCGYFWEEYYGDTPFLAACERKVHKDMVKFLDDNAIPYDEIDNGTKGKVSASFYLDDKAVRVENNWPEVVEFIKERTK